MVNRRRSICLYCGSRGGRDPAHAEAARAVARGIAERGWELVYGAGDRGLMGVAARAAQAAGGRVTGFIPTHLYDQEVGRETLDALILTETMHERKKLMLTNAHAVLALPGGAGTLDELVEALTWRQLRLHSKHVVLLDTNGYWQPFIGLIGHMIEEGFAPREFRQFYTLTATPAEALEALTG